LCFESKQKKNKTSICIRNYNENYIERFVCERETLKITHMLQTDEEINSGTHPEKKTVLLMERDILAK